MVVNIKNAVGVIVRIGATVLIFEEVSVFRIIGTLIHRVLHPITVAVRVGTALVGGVTGDQRTEVHGVQHRVTIVVRIGTAVFIFKVVQIFGLIGTLVLGIQNTILVPVNLFNHYWLRLVEDNDLIKTRIRIGDVQRVADVLQRHTMVPIGAHDVTKIEFIPEKLKMRLCFGQLHWSAVIGPSFASQLDLILNLSCICSQLRARHTGHTS